MRALISALAVAGLFSIALPSYSAEDPYTAESKAAKPGRAIEEGAVKSGGATDKPGRAIEEGAVKSGGATDKPGRAVEEESVKTGGKPEKPGRAVEKDNKK